jgi:hypothetical protein
MSCCAGRIVGAAPVTRQRGGRRLCARNTFAKPIMINQWFGTLCFSRVAGEEFVPLN